MQGNLPEPLRRRLNLSYLIEEFECLDLAASPEIEPALLSPFLAAGDFANFSGPPGCGKSRLAADIILGAVAAHREGRALGGLFQFDLEQLKGCNVAIIDAENNRFRWQSVLKQKLLREGIEKPDLVSRVVYLRPYRIGLQDPSRWQQAAEDLAEGFEYYGVKLVIGDTLARIWAPEDINSAAWIQRGFAPFRAACQQRGISGVMLTHTAKSKDSPADGPIGTSFQEGQADVQIMIKRLVVGGRPGIELSHRKSRRPFWIQQGSKVRLQFTPELGYKPVSDWQDVWPHECPDYDAEFASPEPTTREAVSQHLQRFSDYWVATPDIANAFDLNPRTITTHLNALEREGLAEKKGSGPNRRWRWRG